MGHALAQELATQGREVTLMARSEARAAAARDEIDANMERLSQLGALDRAAHAAIRGRIRVETRLQQAVRDTEWVVEAVAEDVDLKRELFAELDRLAPPDALLTSTSSTLMPSLYARDVSRPQRVLGAHFFNPPYLISLVELIRGPQTADEAVQKLRQELDGMGKQAVLIEREVLGFIGSRLQGALAREAMDLVEQGIASAQDVDTVIRGSLARRWVAMGLFGSFDLIGWDIVEAAGPGVLADLSRAKELPSLVAAQTASGNLGLKSGRGVYEWTPEKAAALRSRLAQLMLELDRQQVPL